MQPRLLGLLAIVCLGCSGVDGDPAAPAEIDSAPALDALNELRSRHRVKVGGTADYAAALPASDAIISRVGDRLERRAAADERLVDVALPTSSNGRLRLRAAKSGLAVEASLVDARPAPAEIADGYVVYRAGGPLGSTLLHRPTAQGTEDYLAFERAPAVESVAYDITLSPEVAGLRLVADTLEFLDDTANPQLRVAAPYLVDANGRQVPATLSVSGCDFDTDPRPPWDRDLTPPGSSSCRVHVDWTGTDVVYPALLDPTWSSTIYMQAARYLFPAVKLNDGKVYVSGGYNAFHLAFDHTEIYNNVTFSWATTANLPVARAEHTATLLNDGKVLVAGGVDSFRVAKGNANVYDPSATNPYSTVGSMNSTRTKHTATLLVGGKVLVTGGLDAIGIEQSSAELYTPSSANWASAGSMLVAQSDHRAIQANTGEILVVGRNAPSAQRYNPVSGVWEATGNLAVPRSAGALATLPNGLVMYSGGIPAGTNAPSGVVELYNPALLTWTRTGSLWYPHAYHTATLADNGRMFVIGGNFGNIAANAAVEVFNPTWGVWTLTQPMPTPRGGHIAVKLNNGSIFAAGGSPFVFVPPTNSSAELNPSINTVAEGDYKLPPSVDPLIISGHPTELWAAVYRPTTLLPGWRYPLILFLHGHHQICSGGGFTYVPGGECPAGQTVIQNHAGYKYIAQELAERGYIVVSINANRINALEETGPNFDTSHIHTRGRLVLRHLQKLSEWNRGVSATPSSIGTSLSGKIDFSQVGLMGHSRGGEAMRAAQTIYQTTSFGWPSRIGDPVTVRGIIELAGTDRATPSLQALNTKWVTVMPMCDGDVDMEGMRMFDREITNILADHYFKATYTIWGAKHNAFNTEWRHSSDPFGGTCIGPGNRLIANASTGHPEQLQAGFQAMLAFFVGNVGWTNPSFNEWLNPAYPAVAEPNVDRGYTPSANAQYSLWLEEFFYATGTSSWGVPNDTSNVTVEHRGVPHHGTVTLPHHGALRGARIFWWGAGLNYYFQINFGQNVDLTGKSYLDIRLARTDLDPSDQTIGSWLNPVEPTNFEVRLVKSDGNLSGPAEIAQFGKLDGPVGALVGVGEAGGYDVRALLETVRIPLYVFLGATPLIRGVRFTFSKTPTGDIHVSSIRATVP